MKEKIYTYGKEGREDWGRSKGMRVMKEKIYTYGKEGREDWGGVRE